MTTTAIHRGRLQQLLVSQLPAASLHVGMRCTQVVSDRDEAVVHFADGRVVRAGLVIGADGLRSVTREWVKPGVRLRYAGQSAYRGVAHVRLEDALRHAGREVWGAGCRAGFGAIGRDEVYWFVALDAPAGDGDAPGTMRAHVAALVADFPAPIPALIAASSEAQIIRTDLYDFVPMRPWHRGRVVLIGDAAHATTPNLGQGGAQAIEDAWVLADRLSRGGPLEESFASFESARAQKAKVVVERSLQFGRIVHLSNPIARALRNFVVRHTPASVAERQMAYLFRVAD